MCASDVSPIESVCGAYISCYQACQCSDGTCVDNCFLAATPACASALQTSNSCSACKAECRMTATATTPTSYISGAYPGPIAVGNLDPAGGLWVGSNPQTGNDSGGSLTWINLGSSEIEQALYEGRYVTGVALPVDAGAVIK